MRHEPPKWIESVLRWFLNPRDRDTITGDLLEEFRELAAQHGLMRARFWYCRHALSLIGRSGMFNRRFAAGFGWSAIGVWVLSTLLYALYRTGFQPQWDRRRLVAVGGVLALSALTALRPKRDFALFWRLGRIWAGLFLAVIAIRLIYDALVPFDLVQFVLAQSRSDFSELHFPRRIIVEAALMLIFMGAGFQGALRTHRFRTGVLLAVASALIVCLPWFALISFVNHAPLDAIEIMLSLSAIMGSIGSLFGQGFGGLVSRWHEPSAV